MVTDACQMGAGGGVTGDRRRQLPSLLLNAL